MDISDSDFEKLISQAMDELPQEYIKGLDNVAVLYADEPSEYQRETSHLHEHSILLGLYEGIPLTKRGTNYTFVLPDKITLFKYPILSVVSTPQQLFEQIKRTLWHEIAHFYGLEHSDIDRVQRPSDD